MDKASLVRKIKEKFGAEIRPWPEQEEIDADTPMPVPNRRDKRRAKQYGKGSSSTGTVHDALRLGARPGRTRGATGQPLWFRQMKYDEQRRKALEKVQLDRLEPAVGRIALDLFHAGYKSVWQVTQVEDITEFLKHGKADCPDHGIRVEDLKKLRAYLVQQRVPVKWEA